MPLDKLKTKFNNKLAIQQYPRVNLQTQTATINSLNTPEQWQPEKMPINFII